jgi:hypothetical protein
MHGWYYLRLAIPDDVKLCSSLYILWDGQKAHIHLTLALAVKVENSGFCLSMFWEDLEVK